MCTRRSPDGEASFSRADHAGGMKHTVTRRDVLASIPVVALAAVVFSLQPAPDQPAAPETPSASAQR